MAIKTGLNRNYLKIGIVLPEDEIDQIDICLPSEESVVKSVDSDAMDFHLSLEGDAIRIRDRKGENAGLFEELSFYVSDDLGKLKHEYGIMVNPVIAGRGFHWQKRICVMLPGKITVKVVHGHLFLVNTLSVEAYVVCVATSEMGSKAPAALLEAQTVVARCYVLASVEHKFEDLGIDFCNDDSSQRYQGTTYLTDYSLQAARQTESVVLTYNDEVIDARYSKNCGGVVEDASNVWDGYSAPYLTSFWDGETHPDGLVQDDMDKLFSYDDAFCSDKRFKDVDLMGMLGKVDVAGQYYHWELDVPKEIVLRNLKKYYSLEWENITGLEILARGNSGRISLLKLNGEDKQRKAVSTELKSEYRIRQVLSESFLYSSAFVLMNPDSISLDSAIKLKGAGWGHGVGLCQMGALGMALAGYSYQDIVLHYYPGSKIQRI